MLSDNHWKIENYRERITTKEWQQILLNNQDSIIFRGTLYKLKAEPLGCGVVEVYKEKDEL